MAGEGESPKTPQLRVVPSENTVHGADGEMVETRESFIEQALAEYESPLIGYAQTIVKDVDRARDVVQDTFIRLCRQDVSKVREGLKSWLYTVCRNRALDVLRKEGRVSSLDDLPHHHPVAETEISPADEADREERVAQVLRYLDRLPENQRMVILMKFRDGKSYKEIADETGLSSGNIGFLIHTGLKRIRQLLPPDLMDGY
ncbi:RNA polymerase sigma-70 factor (ECF subfamily) [Haloferula luteola]|uniref:RNA polymerase sigma-70 factor (ECF subfamily) n=1 Tax=Haloferula luteola TaxID=595692 RepID=A0A840UYW4_9BACT|nr:RNA polymerase sigma factor [Haloferula luteola]MBB5350972.1 RNA polymerase sigma-70 factor (ECF subfamily) [Haloferula luteola]